jgi:protein TonB
MTRNMFRDVVDPSITVGNRRGYTVPLSIVAHAVVIALLIIIPIVASDVAGLPLPPTLMSFIVARATPPALPAAPPRLSPARPVATSNPDAAPVSAPRDIAPEPDVQPARHLAGAVEGGGTFTGTVPGGAIVDVAPPPAAAPPPAPLPLRPGGDIREPAKTRDVPPVYPQIAQMARVEGVVIIEATISAAGRVQDARVIRSIPMLDAAALDAVRQWEYRPTLLNGVAVPVIITITVNFRLR